MEKELRQLINNRNRAEEVEKKKELDLYLNTNHIFSYNNKGITDFIYTAVRGVGKSVISVETAIILKRKYGYENVKCFYFRLKDQSIKAMIANHARLAVDPYLVHKYDLEITCKNNIVYDHGKELIEFYPLVAAGSKGKGVNLYDCTFLDPKELLNEDGSIKKKRFIVTIWDEFLMAEGVETRSVGDPVSQYLIYKEAILRDAQRLPQYNAVYNFLLANNVSECAAVTGALYNYIPDPKNYNRVFLTRKHAMFWNVPITEKYNKKRKNSYNSNIIDYANDPNYSALHKDLSLIKPRKTRIRKVTSLLKFDNIDKNKWFCIYDGKYIRKYHNECIKKDLIIAMYRHMDDIFIQELVNEIIEAYDVNAYYYADLMSMSLFTAQMKLLKK
ncbi:MAG: hypothetical protein J6Y28_08680 [Acholeplasmatales bacterium]|nr:hypothetical protein [Acholeplasmatales bacterium]